MHLLTFKKGLLFEHFFTLSSVSARTFALCKKLQFVNHETCQFFNLHPQGSKAEESRKMACQS
jgi:hypothetical protein